MAEFLFLMHDDYDLRGQKEDWGRYIQTLEAADVLRGGSAIGSGHSVRRTGTPAPMTANIVGYIKVEAGNLIEAQALLPGNPVYDAGGTVEIRELLVTE